MICVRVCSQAACIEQQLDETYSNRTRGLVKPPPAGPLRRALVREEGGQAKECTTQLLRAIGGPCISLPGPHGVARLLLLCRASRLPTASGTASAPARSTRSARRLTLPFGEPVGRARPLAACSLAARRPRPTGSPN